MRDQSINSSDPCIFSLSKPFFGDFLLHFFNGIYGLLFYFSTAILILVWLVPEFSAVVGRGTCDWVVGSACPVDSLTSWGWGNRVPNLHLPQMLLIWSISLQKWSLAQTSYKLKTSLNAFLIPQEMFYYCFSFSICRYMLGLAAVPSIVMFFGCLVLPESPRWLVSRGYSEKAKKVLVKLRGTVNVGSELDAMKNVCDEEESLHKSSECTWNQLCFLYYAV